VDERKKKLKGEESKRLDERTYKSTPKEPGAKKKYRKERSGTKKKIALKATKL